MAFLATCLDCDKRFRVPHRNKLWSCKVCDGVPMLGDEEASEPDLKPTGEPKQRSQTECEACGASNGASANFCDECGGTLGGADGKAKEHSAKREKRAKVAAAGVPEKRCKRCYASHYPGR